MTNTQTKAPLEDVMAAMDVVDTLRHQHALVDRELDGEGRRERLLDKLRELYAAQGLNVPDRVLQEGIDALEQERFQYQAPPKGLASKLAGLYVARQRWGKFVGVFVIAGVVFGGIHLFNEVLPEKRLRQALPNDLRTTLSDIEVAAKNPDIVQRAQAQVASAQAALKNDELAAARSTQADLANVLAQLRQRYLIKIISRPNQSSGVWRIPDVNQNSKNYYLIVEALNDKGAVIKLPIVNEENGKTKTVEQWGLRVNEQTFYAVSADKQDDGIIQNNVVGEKQIGYLEPKFSVPTTGATITDW